MRTPPTMVCLFILPLSFLSFVNYLQGPFNLRGKTPIKEVNPHWITISTRLLTLELGPTGVRCRFARHPNLQKHQPMRKYWLNFEPKRVSYWPLGHNRCSGPPVIGRPACTSPPGSAAMKLRLLLSTTKPPDKYVPVKANQRNNSVTFKHK